MAVYRKLAASSAAAIQAALQRRLQRLIASPQGSPARDLLPDLFASEHFDARYAGEYEENAASETREVFFDGEEDALKDLLDQVNRLVEHDQKLAVFVEQLVTIIDSYQIGTKVLIFTEYLATQQYLRRALETRFGERCVELIHGGQAHDERRAAIARFEGEAQFLVSTEAGGEGINLHTRCHVMVNYDLPWNPMRLVQRIGRLYRYGQKERVIVFNVHAPETIDAKVVGIMYERLHQVVHDMAVLGGEFREGMEDDILGQMAELLDLDIEQLLENAQGADIARSQARIDEALLRAREAAEHQAEVLSHVARYDPTDVQGALAVDRRHVRAFVDQMLAHAGVEVLQRLHQDREWDLRIPEQLVHVSPGFRRRLRITLDREWAESHPQVHMMDLTSPLMQHLLASAKASVFGGRSAALAGLSAKYLFVSVLRWQNNHAQRMRQELVLLELGSDGQCRQNSTEASEWLLANGSGPTSLPHVEQHNDALALARKAIDRRLAEASTEDLHPENNQWISAGWL